MSRGISVIAIEPRAEQDLRTLVEDVQTAVAFAKSSESTPKLEAYRVWIVASGEMANAAIHYASASVQMHLIVERLVAVSPHRALSGTSLASSLRQVRGIPVLLAASVGDKVASELIMDSKQVCQTDCQTLSSPGSELGGAIFQGSAAEGRRKELLRFLKGEDG